MRVVHKVATSFLFSCYFPFYSSICTATLHSKDTFDFISCHILGSELWPPNITLPTTSIQALLRKPMIRSTFCIDLGLWSLRSPIPSIASYLFMMGGAGERWGLNSWGCNPDKWPNEGWTGWCSLCCCGCCCSINRGCCCSCCGCSVAAAAVAATVQDMMKFCIEASILRDGQKKHGAVMTIFCHPEGF